jgi:hypothetical protein
MKSVRVFVLILSVSTLSLAADHEFRGVVRAMESSYGVHHMHISLLGFALFFVRPEGVSGLKLAAFENFSVPSAVDDVDRIVENSLGPDWHPFVRVRSKHEGEATLIYASPEGAKLRMMIISVESSETAVVELKLSERGIKRWIAEPQESAENHSCHGRHHAGN